MFKVKILSGVTELDEGRKDDAIAFVNKIPPEAGDKKQKYEQALQVFLSNPIADNKYILWMLKHLEEADDVDAMILAISYYDMFQKNIESGNPLKDINSINSFEELKDVVDDYEKSIKELEREGQKIIVSREQTSNRFEVIRPLNVYASCQTGRNSRWCIAATKSKNYYRQYSRSGLFFYVIMDYSKPVKDPSSMFAYVINKIDIDKTEIYNANNDKVTREGVQALIGKANEERFYQKMKDEAGVGVQSTTLEKYNTFFMRLMRMIKELPVYDQVNVEIPEADDSKFVDVQTEVQDYFEEWEEIYSDKTKPSSARKNALRHMILFVKKVAAVDNILAKYRIGQIIKDDYVDDIPQLREPTIDLLRNPEWLREAPKTFRQITVSLKDKDRYELEDENFFSRLFEYSEQAVYNDRPEYLNELFDEFQSQRRDLDPYSPDQDQIIKLNSAVESITKAAVFNNHPSSLKFLYNIIHDNSYSLGIVHQIMNTTYGVAKKIPRAKKYADKIFEFVLDKYKSSERYGAKLDDLYSMILKTNNISVDKYEEALDNSRNRSDVVTYAYHHNINNLSPKYQEKVADEIIKFVKRTTTTTMAQSLANAMYSVCLSDSLPKQKISQILELLFESENQHRNLPGRLAGRLIEKWENDREINSLSFKKYIEKRKAMYESKLFRFDAEHKIYRILR